MLSITKLVVSVPLIGFGLKALRRPMEEMSGTYKHLGVAIRPLYILAIRCSFASHPPLMWNLCKARTAVRRRASDPSGILDTVDGPAETDPAPPFNVLQQTCHAVRHAMRSPISTLASPTRSKNSETRCSSLDTMHANCDTIMQFMIGVARKSEFSNAPCASRRILSSALMDAIVRNRRGR